MDRGNADRPTTLGLAPALWWPVRRHLAAHASGSDDEKAENIAVMEWRRTLDKRRAFLAARIWARTNIYIGAIDIHLPC